MVDRWLGETITDLLFFSAIDAWIGETNICGAASSAGAPMLELNGVELNMSPVGRSATFQAEGAGIASMEVDVFQLDGERVFSQSAAGARLSWNMTGSDGATLANGVYLYSVRVRGADGVLQSQVKSFALMR